ncbi:flagellar biosynthetic protein FlhB [Legionella birminghamensis]|uniref:Flagellar biosynthetic protein FlhB n=1 Tax=Legionella birminghamensis TaxID=28083 RepID=A0A378IGF7_9GAMM|nr:flagellar biosynthesis protein FlhB [Legionella birminghamensis]KTC68007.1 flagellar biosynthetic protein FlhB [Legionella birminghamensis]STX31284.1 flagellar biosynthetic protein FlhB [Legionella birminghamensis]
MAEEEQSQEKTEQPSAKRIREAREKGQVLRSKDFNATLILIFSSLGFLLLGRHLADKSKSLMQQSLHFNLDLFKTDADLFYKIREILSLGIGIGLPTLLLILLLSVIAPLLIGGWVCSFEAVRPQLSRMNPMKGLKRMVSLKAMVEMTKSFLKFLLVASVALIILHWQIPSLMALANFSVETAIGEGLRIISISFLMVCSCLILIAALDVPFQWYEYQKQLKMTRQEVKDEYKETEGKPEVKGHIRRMQQEISRRRMMAEVPKADVVLTNPTHFAVALQYKQKGNRAPVVVAKGKDMIAFQINKVALSHKVPILSLPPLTRAIYFSTGLNKEIPRGLYVAVAQVLAYIFQLKNRQYYERQPSTLNDLPIPEELRRSEEGN